MSKQVLITDYAWPSIDIEREVFKTIGADVVVAQVGDEADLLQYAPTADAILTNWRQVPTSVLDAAPNCMVVARYGVGVDNIPVDYATELGITVTNIPDFCVEEVADHTMALLLACARKIVPFVDAARAGKWGVGAIGPGIQRLRGQTLGIVGYGRLGKATAQRAVAFGLNVIAYTPRIATGLLAEGVTGTNDLDAMLSAADFVSLLLPARPDSIGMIDASALSKMKPTAYLINTSRGSLIDEDALHHALTSGGIAGAALDVLANEPPKQGFALGKLDNVIITPHAAFYSEQALADVERRTAQQAADCISGKVPNNVVNPAVFNSPNYRARLTK